MRAEAAQGEELFVRQYAVLAPAAGVADGGGELEAGIKGGLVFESREEPLPWFDEAHGAS